MKRQSSMLLDEFMDLNHIDDTDVAIWMMSSEYLFFILGKDETKQTNDSTGVYDCKWKNISEVIPQ